MMIVAARQWGVCLVAISLGLVACSEEDESGGGTGPVGDDGDDNGDGGGTGGTGGAGGVGGVGGAGGAGGQISTSQPECGDGKIDEDEECDGGDDCSDACVPLAICGDGKRSAAEECDDGNTETESCEYGLEECRVCDGSCELFVVQGEYCGDGSVQSNESCDPGSEGETCDYGIEKCEICGNACQYEEASGPYCGDGIANAGEQCDDGTLISEDSFGQPCDYGVTSECEVCDNNCRTRKSNIFQYCGDGETTDPESCDGESYCNDDCSGEPPPLPTCEECAASPELNVEFVKFNEACNNAPLCLAVKQCIVEDTSRFDGLSCYSGVGSDCFCGMGADASDCQNDQEFVANGPCAEEMRAGVSESASNSDVFFRWGDLDFATGRATAILDYLGTVAGCGVECGFTER